MPISGVAMGGWVVQSAPNTSHKKVLRGYQRRSHPGHISLIYTAAQAAGGSGILKEQWAGEPAVLAMARFLFLAESLAAQK